MRLLRHLRAERGLALPLALGVMFVLTIASTTAIYYSSTNARSASMSKSGQIAFSLAEAGLNNAMAVLSNPTNNALNPRVFCAVGQALPCSQSASYAGGTATWTGTFDDLTVTWTIAATGTVRNPTGAAAATVVRKLSAKVPVTPTVKGPLNNQAWNYVYAWRTGTPPGSFGLSYGCDQLLSNDATFGSALFVQGNLCLDNKTKITGGPLNVKGNAYLNTSDNSIGTSSAPITQGVHVGGTCKWKSGGTPHSPCTSADNVFANPLADTSPSTIAVPTLDFDTWYLNGSPGPYFPCYTKTGSPPAFDSPVAASTASDATKLTYRNNNQPVFELTPGSSYSCKTAGGELSWNAATRVLTVSGTIFIDGSIQVTNRLTNSYNGQATIYLSGTFYMEQSKLCAGLASGGGDCDFGVWNPNTEMLTIVANGVSSGGNGFPAGDSVDLVQSRFEGAIYGAGPVFLDNTSQTEGPMVAPTFIIQSPVKTYPFGTITTVPAGMPGNPTVFANPNPPQMFSG